MDGNAIMALLGVPPGAEEMARAFIFLLVTIAYAGVWLSLAITMFGTWASSRPPSRVRHPIYLRHSPISCSSL